MSVSNEELREMVRRAGFNPDSMHDLQILMGNYPIAEEKPRKVSNGFKPTSSTYESEEEKDNRQDTPNNLSSVDLDIDDTTDLLDDILDDLEDLYISLSLF